MKFEQTFAPLELSALIDTATDYKQRGYRFVQLHPIRTDEGIDLVYSWIRDGEGVLENRKIKGIQPGTKVPSITGLALAAFVFENEAHDLFGVDIEGNALDFGGTFYTTNVESPMTVISPAQKAAREKAAKVAAAKAAKEAKAAGASTDAGDADAAFEAKLAGMDPEKAAKVRAAKAAKEAKEKQAALDEKLAGMDPEKAAKVKAAMEAKAAREAQKGE